MLAKFKGLSVSVLNKNTTIAVRIICPAGGVTEKIPTE
jgi:hypothetical protein